MGEVILNEESKQDFKL